MTMPVMHRSHHAGTVCAAALVVLMLLVPAHGAAQQVHLQTEARPAPTGTLVIRDLDEVWTAAGRILVNTSIAVRDGRITAIGPDVATPAGAVVIDGRGLTAIPGIVDDHSHIAMGAGTNEGTAPIVPEVRVIDALNPRDWGIYQALSGGVTTTQVLHGSANPIGGQSAIIKTRWGMDDGFRLLVEGAPRTVKFALGENVTQKNRSTPTDRFPASRAGVESVYDQAFTAAQEYRQAWAEHRRNPRGSAVPPRRDLRLEALVDIMEGRIRVHAHSYRSDEILMLMRVAERYGFQVDVFTHVLEGYRVADEMRQHGAAGSTFSDWWMYKLEAFDATPWNAAMMHNAGVRTSLNSDIPWLQSSMLYEMQKPVKYGGVPKQDALVMLTLNPAKNLRIDHLVGSLEVGKHGDIVLLNGDPFNTFTRVEKTIVDGIVYYDRTDEATTAWRAGASHCERGSGGAGAGAAAGARECTAAADRAIRAAVAEADGPHRPVAGRCHHRRDRAPGQPRPHCGWRRAHPRRPHRRGRHGGGSADPDRCASGGRVRSSRLSGHDRSADAGRHDRYRGRQCRPR
jgi:imidazolonepropionase-like amidohydrolase